MSEDLATDLTDDELNGPPTKGDMLLVKKTIEDLAHSNSWRRRGERWLPAIAIIGTMLTIASVGIGILAFVAASRASAAADETRRQAQANSTAFACIRAWAEITTERSSILSDARQDYDDASKKVFVDAFNPDGRTPTQQRRLLISDGVTLTKAAADYDKAKLEHPVPPAPQFTC